MATPIQIAAAPTVIPGMAGLQPGIIYQPAPQLAPQFQAFAPRPKRERFPGEDKCKLFIGGLPYDTTDAQLRNYFGQFGEIVDSVIMVDKATGRPRGFGFVTFKSLDSVDAVINKVGGHQMDGRMLQVRKYFPKAEYDAERAKQVTTTVITASEPTSASIQFKGPMKITPELKIFVGGIAPGTTETDVERYFSEFGKVIAVDMPLHNVYRAPRGFAFVGFESTEVVAAITKDRYHQINGKTVEVKGCDEQEAYLRNKREHGSYRPRPISTVPSAIPTIGYAAQPQIQYQLPTATLTTGLGATAGYTVIPAGYSYDPTTGVIYQAAVPGAVAGTTGAVPGAAGLAAAGQFSQLSALGLAAGTTVSGAPGLASAAALQRVGAADPTAALHAAYGHVAFGQYSQENSAFGAQRAAIASLQGALPVSMAQLAGSDVLTQAQLAADTGVIYASQSDLARSTGARGFHPYVR